MWQYIRNRNADLAVAYGDDLAAYYTIIWLRPRRRGASAIKGGGKKGEVMDHIRKATVQDASRIAEILIFTKRMNYRDIFHDDKVSFGEMQVYPLVLDYMSNPERLENIWVYDDGIVKGMVHIEGGELAELYVDSFFQGEGIGGALVEFAVRMFGVQNLFVLEKMSVRSAFISVMAFR